MKEVQKAYPKNRGNILPKGKNIEFVDPTIPKPPISLMNPTLVDYTVEYADENLIFGTALGTTGVQAWRKRESYLWVTPLDGETSVGNELIQQIHKNNVKYAAITLSLVSLVFALSVLWSMYFLIGFLSVFIVGNLWKNSTPISLKIDDAVAVGTMRYMQSLFSVLKKHPNSTGVTAVIRGKMNSYGEGIKGVSLSNEFNNWIYSVVHIFQMDPEFEPELIPLTADHIRELAQEMSDQLRAEKAIEQNNSDSLEKERKKLAATEKEIAEYRVSIEQKALSDDSDEILKLALERLKIRKEVSNE